MPHEIAYTVDGEAMMMFVGDEPWHGLGTRMDDLVDPMTAVQVARCDYTVEAQPMYRNDGSTSRPTAMACESPSQLHKITDFHRLFPQRFLCR